MALKKAYKKILAVIVLLICAHCVNAQCISSFPYLQDFEASNGGWVDRGSNSDWAWGKPQKSIINSAYSGDNCWVVGGLTGESYNGNEASWIQSPCFDLSALQKPLITFNIRWESETGWDGTGFQYSLDDGSSWKDVGSTVDPKDCLNENWFNTSSVRFLAGLMQSGSGWTGSSGGWVGAKKAIPAIAGKNNVIFRFVFASGSQQNNYNGVAIDDFGVSEAPPILSLTSTITTPINCNGDNNGAVTVNLTNGIGPFTYNWNTNPVQTDATATNLKAGTYKVTVSGPNVCTSELIVNLTEPPALGHKVAVLNPGCVIEKGSISIAETGGTPPYTYSWSPNVSNTFSATGLTSGRYDITVTDKLFCTDIISIDLIDIFPPTASISDKTDAICNGENSGTATVSVTGGTDPVEYSWNTNPVQTTTTASRLKAGSYIFTAKDANGCTGNASVTITEPTATTVNVITKDATCNLPNASINLSPSGGAGNYEYTWTPAISTSASATNINPGNYTVSLKDNAGCVTNVSGIYVANFGTSTKLFLGKDTTICTGERIVLSGPAAGNYLWQDNSTQQLYTVNKTGKYWLRFTNSNNCVSSDTINVNVVTNCVDIYFPSIFSPNNDGMNDQFGPVGNLNAVSNYKLSIYNRWGQLVFTTENPRQRWSGEKGTQINATSTYVWYASYNFRGSGDKYKKGTLIITR